MLRERFISGNYGYTICGTMGREKRVRLSEEELEIIKKTKKKLAEEKGMEFLKGMALGAFLAWMGYEITKRLLEGNE